MFPNTLMVSARSSLRLSEFIQMSRKRQAWPRIRASVVAA